MSEKRAVQLALVFAGLTVYLFVRARYRTSPEYPPLVSQMNLRAWFDPKVASNPRQWLADRQVLGDWPLRRFEEVPGKRLYLHQDELRLADGSSFRISAACDWTFAEPQITLTIASGEDPVTIITGHGTSGLSASIATGKGGFLALQIWFQRDADKRENA